MQVKCDRCGGQTQPKEITAKKDGKKYTVYECQGNCMNGRFKYTCFAPKEPNTTTPNGSKPSGESLSVLRSIDTSLKNILNILQQKSRVVSIQQNELQPDNEIPF